MKPKINVEIDTIHVKPEVGKPGNTENNDPITKPKIAAQVKYVQCVSKYLINLLATINPTSTPKPTNIITGNA